MKSALGVLGVLFMMASASAAEKIYQPVDGVAAEGTYYDQLGELFARGTQPNPEHLVNTAWSGRCFKKDAPTTPINGGYVFRVKTPADAGPITAGEKAFEAATYWDPNKAANYFDDKSLSQILDGTLVKPEFGQAVSRSNALVIPLSSGVSMIRVNGKFLVEEILDANLEPSTVAIRCYYFIPGYTK